MLPDSTAAYQSLDFQQFYTDAPEIGSLMQWLLGDVSGLRVLEPCAGRGAFIFGLEGTPEFVDAIDIDEQHIADLQSKAIPWLNVIHADFIDAHVNESLFAKASFGQDYDALICNPPYGLRFSVAYRQALKRKYPKLYARESYGLFMVFAIRALRASGRYVFIVPDTFLTSRNHKPLRDFILAEAAPTHIIRFKSKRFETVNFGYGQLCIIAGNRRPLQQHDEIEWVDALGEEQTIAAHLLQQSETIPGSFLFQHLSDGWVHPKKHEAMSLTCPTTELGAIAECRTGIYTGDNIRFCGYDSENPPARCTNGHPIKWSECVALDPLSDLEKKHGIQVERCYVPFIRGGHRQPFAKTSWALNWSKEAVTHYARDKKARLQNCQFYFQPGLAIPMVTSGRISASLMELAVFDQGVVGVFPHDPKWLSFLLLYINSEFVSKSVKSVLSPGANNSANYIKRIPVPIPSPAQLAEADRIVHDARTSGWEETSKVREAYIARLTGSNRVTTEDNLSNLKDEKSSPTSISLTGLPGSR